MVFAFVPVEAALSKRAWRLGTCVMRPVRCLYGLDGPKHHNIMSTTKENNQRRDDSSTSPTAGNTGMQPGTDRQQNPTGTARSGGPDNSKGSPPPNAGREITTGGRGADGTNPDMGKSPSSDREARESNRAANDGELRDEDEEDQEQKEETDEDMEVETDRDDRTDGPTA